MDFQNRARRPRTMPPPPAGLPAHELLGDVEDSLARVLGRALSDIRDWIDRDPVVRAVSSVADVREHLAYVISRNPDLEEALGTFGLLRASPRLATVGNLARACREVHDWAESQGLVGTAVLFGEASATVDTDNSILAALAGRAARRIAETHRAETWYDRAYTLAARHKNRREQINALVGHGGLLRETGRYSEARALFDRAARLASSTRRHRQAAEVQHELLTIAAEQGSYPEAEHYMRAALREYPIHHRAVPWLGHDWAFLLVRLGYHAQARVLLEAILPHVTRRDLQIVVQATLARAAAGTGMRERYERARNHVLGLVGVHGEYGAAALAHLAVGAQFFREWEMAEHLAARAVELARDRHQGDVERGALEILDAISTRSAPLPQQPLPPNSRIPMIEQRMLMRLQERKKPRRRGVSHDPEAGGRPARPPTEGQPTGPRTDPAAAE